MNSFPLLLYSKWRTGLVDGKAVINASCSQFDAQLADISDGGSLLLSHNAAVPVGEPITARLAIAAYPLEIQAKGRVVRSDPDVIGIAFVEPPPELDELILWLEAGFLSTIL